MRNSSVFSSLKSISAAYSKTLQEIPEEQFQLTPPIGGWSYSEVYSHIFDISILTLKEVENCIKVVLSPLHTTCDEIGMT